jgi:hypothetical protein
MRYAWLMHVIDDKTPHLEEIRRPLSATSMEFAMRQTTLAVASLLAANVGFSQSQAVAAAADFVTDNSPNNLTVKQQKAIFAFSRDQASMTMNLIERWPHASVSERDAMTAEFVAAFYGAIKTHPDSEAIVSEFGPSLLMADTLGNAKYLVAEKGTMASAEVDAVVEAIKGRVMRICYETNGDVVVPYVPDKLAWGQHGQHFVRGGGGGGGRKPPKSGRR